MPDVIGLLSDPVLSMDNQTLARHLGCILNEPGVL